MWFDGRVSTPAPLSYPLHETTLPNGLRVIVSPDRGAPVVVVNLWYGVGSRDEDLGLTGVAHLFEHVMFQGSANVASGEHLSSLQAAGATCNATTWFDRTNYFEAVPTGALDLALWLEADRLGGLLPALTQENLDTQREVVKEEKRQRYDNVPYGDVIDHLLALSFPTEHPYGHSTIGSMADLDAASLADAHAFFSTWYVPNNAVLTLVGDVDVEDAFARVRHAFAHLSPGAVPARRTVEPLSPHVGVPRARVSAPVPADSLYLAWRLPARGTPEFDACSIALDVLGGSQTSRLHRRLVRQEESSAGAGASAIGLAWGNSLGFAYARALEGHALADLEAQVVDELGRLVADGPTQEEIERFRVQFEREWLTQCARLESRADLFSGYASLHGDPSLVNTRIPEMLAITPADVRDAARQWLNPDARAVLEYRRGPFEEAS